MPSSDNAMLSVRDLRVQYETADGTISAVAGVSFDVAAGEIVALVGESGCGKSTVALAMLRLIEEPGRIAGGKIYLDGRDLLGLSERGMRSVRGNEMSMVFQEPMTTLNPVHRIDRQVGEPLRLHARMGARAAAKASVDLLRSVQIPAPERRSRDYPHSLSGGMRQRVVIAMGMACAPKVIIADEPTTALDVTVQAQVLDLLKSQVQERNLAMLLITHNLGIVARYARRVYVMYAGRIVESAPTEELYASPRHPYSVGLLKSVPRLDQDLDERLAPIPGAPPDPLARAKGCVFSPRCPLVIDRCRAEEPPLIAVNERHRSACWVMPAIAATEPRNA
ncbi:MAG TPA: ABC transporter ATP-binding protein, partial [Thermomicrobiales bacterium]|nr:ABC transporter ATP-binding protein [Thermomicrobiales bacterium]